MKLARPLPLLLLALALAFAPAARAGQALPPDSTEAGALEPPTQWLHLDPEDDGVGGISTDEAYALLGDAPARRTVVVAVIDSGLDLFHEDLRGRIWTNEAEVPGNGQDDDGNGYVDDVHGWNFLGGPDGRHVEHDTYELTREVARLRARFEGADPAALSPEERADYDRYRELEAELEGERAEYGAVLSQITMIELAVKQAHELMLTVLGPGYTPEALLALKPASPDEEQARGMLLYLAANGITPEQVSEEREAVQAKLDYHYNPDFDPRSIIGDDPDDLSERGYGNPDVAGPDPGHGTAVAGVIAAVRGNGVGLDGVAADVLIMPLRAVPDGDERDKDVANAIRYAVDNGAQVVNMSFGKGISPDKEAVDAAVRYAEERGVLLVHAAGNDGRDLDAAPSYPSRVYLDGPAEAANWLEVGASSWSDSAFVASFSNYGDARVDVFAPGEQLDVLVPGNAYGRVDGTSVAAPVVSGLAALLLGAYPELTPLDVRQILLDSAVRHAGRTVPRPGDGTAVDFATLSLTDGVVNAEAAVQLARERAGGQ